MYVDDVPHKATGKCGSGGIIVSLLVYTWNFIGRTFVALLLSIFAANAYTAYETDPLCKAALNNLAELDLFNYDINSSADDINTTFMSSHVIDARTLVASYAKKIVMCLLIA